MYKVDLFKFEHWVRVEFEKLQYRSINDMLEISTESPQIIDSLDGYTGLVNENKQFEGIGIKFENLENKVNI